MRRLAGLLLLVATALAASPGDPMAPPAAWRQVEQLAAEPLAALRLQQVVLGATPRAAINGRWLRIGEQLGPWRLRHIAARSVVLDDGSRTLRLTLFERGQPAARGD